MKPAAKKDVEVLVKKSAGVPIVHVIKSSMKSHKNSCINSCCLEFPLPWVGLSSTLFFFTMGAWIFQLLLLFSFYSSFVTSTGSVSQVSFKQDSSTSSLKKPFGARLPGKSTSIQTHSMGKTHWRLCELCLQKIKCKKRVFNYKSQTSEDLESNLWYPHFSQKTNEKTKKSPHIATELKWSGARAIS